MPAIRLDKFLADAGYGSRNAVKDMAKQGRVLVNDVSVKKTDIKVDTNSDEIKVDGKIVTYTEYEYFMLHKPAGVVSATTDNINKTVIELITENKRRDLFPVGRLDKDTEGLLLITNDGKLANSLLAPGKHVDKKYFARVNGRVDSKMIDDFAFGVDIGDEELTRPAELRIISVDATTDGVVSEVEVIIHEGRYHQIKRMFLAYGMEVIYLRRLSMGTLTLGANLPCGAYRRLTEEEIEALKK